MIAKMVKGRGFRGAAEYDLGKEQGRIIDSNMAGQNPRELAAEFGEIRKLRPGLGRAVLHVSLSASIGETLTDQQWREIGQRYLRDMGITDNQYIITRHTDTKHEHIHILANRITHGGEVVCDAHDWRRQEAIMRKIERDYGLRQVTPSEDTERKAPTKGEIERSIRTGQPSARQQLQQLCDAAAKDCQDFTVYAERLEAAGVELVPMVQVGGAKLSGLLYRLDGITMKGSDLGKRYTAAGIQKRGISYEQNRDFAAIRRIVERDTARETGEPDRGNETSQIPERGGISEGARAAGAEHGDAGRRVAADGGRPEDGAGRRGEQAQGRDRAPERRPGAQDGRGHEQLPGSRPGGADGSRQPESSRAADGMAHSGDADGGGVRYGGARERILAFAYAADRPEHARPGSSGGALAPGHHRGATPEMKADRSYLAARRQLDAMGGDAFEVGIRDQEGRMMTRSWSKAEVLKAVPWLKRQNALGADIYVRPATADGQNAGLVLLDDVPRGTIERMRADGFAPAAVIETSPDNFQAWVRLSDKPLAPDVATATSRALAKHYDADLNSADWRHFGRLAGFTNRKPAYTDERGRSPYVLAHECPGKAARNAQEAISACEATLAMAEAEKERQRRLNALQTAKPGSYGSRDPVAEYQRQAQRLLQQYGQGAGEADYSRLDWMIATDMAKSRRWTIADIERGIRECSPNVESRKAGHIEDYAKRTAEKAWAAPEVVASRQQRSHSRDDHGLSR